MGNNAAFTSFEASVIACYNKGVLDRGLLDALAKPYKGSDIDRGGMTGYELLYEKLLPIETGWDWR